MIVTIASWLYVAQVIALTAFLLYDWLFGDKHPLGGGHCAECERRQRFRDGWPPEIDYRG